MTSSTVITAPPRRRGLVLAVLCTGMFLVLLDVTVVNVALPAMASGLGANLPALQGVVDAYAVVFAGLLLGAGGVGDRLGHRRTVLLGLTLFGTASLACGLAPVPAALIAARAAQGAGAAFLLPGSLAVLTRVYPERAEQARALGRWAAISSAALPAGPILGGLLVDTVGWRWVFLVNLPVVAIALVGLRALVPAGDVGLDRRLDPAGMALAPVVLGALVWAVVAVGHGGVRAGLVPALVVLVGGAAFRYVERRVAAPLLPRGLLATRAVLGANGIAFLMNLVTNGTLLVVTLYLQQVRGLSALHAGGLLLILALPLAGLAAVSGRLTARYGARPPVIVGVLLGAAGAATLAQVGLAGSWVPLLLGLGALGAGDGLIVTAAVAVAMRAMPPEHAGLAGGLNNTARQLGTAFGVALFGAVTGPASAAGRFVAGLHLLAWLAVAAWLGALALTGCLPQLRARSQLRGAASASASASRRKTSRVGEPGSAT